ncbi:MAG: MinD/ParA family protein [Planctomycetota bacterium]
MPIRISDAAAQLQTDESEIRDLLMQHRDRFASGGEGDVLADPDFELLRMLVREAHGEALAPIVTVTSGKGGVGKTSTSVNVAVELSKRGRRVILLDADLGLANAHIVAGLRAADRTLSDYLQGDSDLIDIVMDGPAGLKIISGGSGIKEMADLDQKGRTRIIDAVRALRPHCDLILIDTGAGIGDTVTDFVKAADHTLVVTTGNFAAIADAYGIIKVLAQSGYEKPMHVIVNRARSPEEAEQVFTKLNGCSRRFLNSSLNWLGLLPEDSGVEGAVLQRTPFCIANPNSVATRYLTRLVDALDRVLPSQRVRVG